MKATALLLLAGAISAQGATLTVTSLADDGSAGTLRALCASAASGDEIVFDDSLAGGTIAITAASGPIEIATTLSIVGPENAPVVLDGQSASALLHASGATSTVTLGNLVFTRSKSNAGNPSADIGPVVSIVGSAVIENCVWTNNATYLTVKYTSSTGDGGGCLRVAGDLSLTGSTFADNKIRGSTYTLGGAVMALGTNVGITNCVFRDNRGQSSGDLVSGGTLGLGAGVASCSVVGSLFEGNQVHFGGGCIRPRSDMTGTIFLKNCAFRGNRAGANGWGGGGGVLCWEGSGSGSLVCENCEFSLSIFRSANNMTGGAFSIVASGRRAVFANCTFANNYAGSWGGATDVRCTAWFVNCTAVGNVSAQNNNAAAGAFFVFSNPTRMLNTVCAWNYKSVNSASSVNDSQRFDSSFYAYNSYNHLASGSYTASNGTRDYDENTVFFSAPFVTLSKFEAAGATQTLAAPISSPVLTVDARKERLNPALPRVADIVASKDGGVLDRAGWPVKHNADWSAIAYSTDKGETWTALAGSVGDATIPLAADSRGAAYPVAGGVPVPPIGSAAVLPRSGIVLLVK